MSMSIRRLAYGLGAEVLGVNPAGEISDVTLAQLIKAWEDHQVLVFRGVQWSLGQQVAFSRRFGELELHPLKYLRNPDFPEVFEVTNRMIDGKPSETGEVGRMWHSDGAYTVRPPTASFLHCHQIPESGGTTWFCNMYLAYERLSETMRKIVDVLEVVNDLFGSGRTTAFISGRDAGKAGEEKAVNPPVIQPMVRVHPGTGRKALFLNPAATRRVLGMNEDESDALLKLLFQQCTKPEFVYCHYWRPHDLVMWDNRCTNHLAPKDYDGSQVRQMFRTTLVGAPHGRYLAEPAGIAVAA